MQTLPPLPDAFKQLFTFACLQFAVSFVCRTVGFCSSVYLFISTSHFRWTSDRFDPIIVSFQQCYLINISLQSMSMTFVIDPCPFCCN